MKLLHTSDWHLGQSFYNYSRDDDHRSFCRQLCGIVSRECPDAMVVAGDLFDVSLPSISAQKLMVELMTRIHDALPSMKIVVIAGNHDSSSRLGINAPLWDAFNISFITSPSLKDGVLDCDSQIIELPGVGFIVATPYLSEFNYSRFVADGSADAMTAYHQLLLDRVAGRNRDSLPVVLAAHLAVAGADPKGQNADRFSFNEIAALGSGYDYAALGHIHYPMTLSGGRARYSGSPVPLGFDECYDHSVTIVGIDRHGAMPVISTVGINQETGVVTVPENPLQLDETIRLVEKLPDDSDDYLRVNVAVDGFLPGNARHQVEQALKGKKYRFCTINPVRNRVAAAVAERVEITSAELKKIEPLDIARRYHQLKTGSELPAEWEKCITRAMEQARDIDSL